MLSRMNDTLFSFVKSGNTITIRNIGPKSTRHGSERYLSTRNYPLIMDVLTGSPQPGRQMAMEGLTTGQGGMPPSCQDLTAGSSMRFSQVTDEVTFLHR